MSVVVIGGGTSLHTMLKNRKGNVKTDGTVTVIMGHDFLEWSLAATYFLASPEEYPRFVAANKETFEYPGVSYVYDPATEVKPDTKEVVCKSGRVVKYDALVVATGYKIPLVHRDVGISLNDRHAEVQAWGAAIKAAGCVVINGAGAVGLELACDIRLKHPHVRVVVLSRSGTVLSDDRSPDVLMTVHRELGKMGVDVVRGEVAADGPTDGKTPLREVPGGRLQLQSGEVIDCNVFLVAFSTGLHTDILPDSMLVAQGPRVVNTNECLQSKQHPEVFAIGVNATGEGFSSPFLEQQAKDVVANLNRFLAKQPLQPHEKPGPLKDKDWGKAPPTIKLGNGPGAYLMFDNLPGSQAAMLKCCGGPFCPPPCCWPCCGIPGLCGWCCAKPWGTGPMKAYLGCFGVAGIKMFAKNFGYKGFGDGLTTQQPR
eukprot:m.161902 g.161902  ORF g.161902 m.161902 type:complete len:427 (+) comp12124_c0_seq1:475-1755(+)